MKAKSRHRVHVITMGCAKNVVDSEKLLAQLRLSNVELAPTIEEADVAVVVLDAGGIPAITRGNDVTGIFGPGFQGATARGFSVLVPEPMRAQAAVVLRRHPTGREEG